MRKIILVGFMGSGKSTIGRHLSQNLDLPFFEMDVEIEKRVGQSISAIFETEGEASFRQLETDMLKEALESQGVVATGGGILTQPENHELLKAEEVVIYLKGTIQCLLTHILADTKNRRPLAENAKEAELQTLLNTREPFYQSVADLVIDIDEKEVPEILEEIVGKLEEMAI